MQRLEDMIPKLKICINLSGSVNSKIHYTLENMNLIRGSEILNTNDNPEIKKRDELIESIGEEIL